MWFALKSIAFTLALLGITGFRMKKKPIIGNMCILNLCLMFVKSSKSLMLTDILLQKTARKCSVASNVELVVGALNVTGNRYGGRLH